MQVDVADKQECGSMVQLWCAQTLCSNMLAHKQRQRCNAGWQETPIPRIQVAYAKVAGIEECKADN